MNSSRDFLRGGLFRSERMGLILGFRPILGFDLTSFGADELTHALAEYKEAVRLKPSSP